MTHSSGEDSSSGFSRASPKSPIQFLSSSDSVGRISDAVVKSQGEGGKCGSLGTVDSNKERSAKSFDHSQQLSTDEAKSLPSASKSFLCQESERLLEGSFHDKTCEDMSACRGKSETELCYCEGDSLNCATLVQNVPLRRANSQSYNMQIIDMDTVTSFDVKDSKSVDNKGLFTTNSRPHRVQESKQDVEREIPEPANMETSHLDSAAVEISTTGTLSSALTVSNSYLKSSCL